MIPRILVVIRHYLPLFGSALALFLSLYGFIFWLLGDPFFESLVVPPLSFLLSIISLVNIVLLLEQDFVFSPQGVKRRVNRTSKRTELAKFTFSVDDPEQQKEFSNFLDTPISQLDPVTQQGNLVITPRQHTNRQILKFIHDIEQKYHGEIRLQIEIEEGSYWLKVALYGFGIVGAGVAISSGISPYTAAVDFANYHALVVMIDEGVEAILNRLSTTYQTRTNGKRAQVKSTISTSKPLDEDISVDDAASKHPLHNSSDTPISVSNTGSSPTATSTVNLHLNHNSLLQNIASLTGWTVITFAVLILVICFLLKLDYRHCDIFLRNPTCYSWTMNFTRLASALLMQLSIFIRGLAEFFYL